MAQTEQIAEIEPLEDVDVIAPQPSRAREIAKKVGKGVIGLGTGVIATAIAVDQQWLGVVGFGMTVAGAGAWDYEALEEFGHDLLEFDYTEFAHDVGRAIMNKLLHKNSPLE